MHALYDGSFLLSVGCPPATNRDLPERAKYTCGLQTYLISCYLTFIMYLPTFALQFQALTQSIFQQSLLIQIAAIVAIVIILYLLFRFGIKLLINSIVGLIVIFAIDYLFGFGLIITLPVVIVVALFGLPAVVVLVILKFFGIMI
jgi:inhibitor of the pro-sigma K processing machinery